MNKNPIIFKKVLVLSFILLVFLSGCISQTPQTTPSSTTSAPTTSFAQFEITDLRVAPENPKIGDTLTILVDVQNRGNSSGSYKVIVSIGMELKSKDIELEARSCKTVEFQEVVDKEGEIEIRAGDLTKKINVSSLETQTPPATTLPPTTPAPTPPENSFFYALIGKFIQTTVYEYEIYLESGDVKPVDVNTVLIPSVSSYHFSQQIFSQKIEYSEAPDKITKRKDDSVRYERAEWTNPPSEITVKRTVECKNIVSYSPFITQSKYPLDTKSLPSSIKKYLDPEQEVQCDDPGIKNLAQSLVKGAESEMDAIVRILNWVRYNVQYTCSKDLKVCEGVSFGDAKRTLKYKKGNCVNFANLSIALLRAAGIPAKQSGGYVADTECESAAVHAWVSVYIPEKGFVEFESSYWMPRSGLVPETILLPQHILFGSIGISNANFSELSRSIQENVSLPEKKISFSESIDKNDIISFPVYAEVEWVTGKHSISFSAMAPEGWKVFLSNETVEIDSDYYKFKEVWVTIMPPSDVKSGDEVEIKIIAKDGSQQEEITLSISIN
ncbi:MAG TPA: transglutaminase domain-containing protein [Methanomicrobia archaeon]|nr:transglutaminase domain-containing protein [Methanomicrobia archaeon]